MARLDATRNALRVDGHGGTQSHTQPGTWVRVTSASMRTDAGIALTDAEYAEYCKRVTLMQARGSQARLYAFRGADGSVQYSSYKPEPVTVRVETHWNEKPLPPTARLQVMPPHARGTIRPSDLDAIRERLAKYRD